MFGLLNRSKSQPFASDRDVKRPGYSDLVDPVVMDQIGHLELLSRTVVDGLLAAGD